MENEPLNYQQHLFFIEWETNQHVPYWFLEDATRDEAEEILKQSNGNVLMRKHSSYPTTGKYIISYQKDTSVFRHYIVLNTPDGYKLDVDHRKNRPVNCLSEVMELFIQLTGHGAQVISLGPGSTNSYHYLKPSYYGPPDYRANEEVEPSGSSLPAVQESPSASHSYVNVSNVMQSLNRAVPVYNKGSEKTHSYINTPHGGSSSSQTKSTPHDYVNTRRINTHSYVNDAKAFGEQ